MPTSLVTWVKGTNSLKDTIRQNSKNKSTVGMSPRRIEKLNQ